MDRQHQSNIKFIKKTCTKNKEDNYKKCLIFVFGSKQSKMLIKPYISDPETI